MSPLHLIGLMCALGATASTMSPRGGEPLRDADTHHMPQQPASVQAWQARAADLREQIRFGLGLWPAPPRTPLKPMVTGHLDGPDYTIDNVAIQTLPGFYLCGNLYRPKGRPGPFPAIVNPHGHWKDGRLERQPDGPRVPFGAPPGKGHADFVAMGVNLAQQGFVVFAYDMVGYGDTMQLGDHHEAFKKLDDWLWGISLGGVQTWNSIRATDYVMSLQYVDRDRVGVTGASGGGTQTILLCAVDERPAAAVPINMVAAYMSGDCECEVAPAIRLGTDNVEIAELIAPKPLRLVCGTTDWTRHVPYEEGPAVKSLYQLHGFPERTDFCQFNYKHNCNVESREAMYAWFARWLRGVDEQPAEKACDLDPAPLHVWNEAHPRPPDAIDEAHMTDMLRQVAVRHLDELTPRSEPGLRRFRREIAPRLALSLWVKAPAVPRTRRSVAQSAAVLLVSDAASADRAAAVRAAISARGCEVSSLAISDAPMTEQQLWHKFYSTYNRTPIGDCVQQVLDALGALAARTDRPVAVVGVGRGGLWSLLAAGLWPVASSVAVDVCGLDTSRDDGYVPDLYAPCLRRTGDFRSAAMLTAPASLCLYNTGGVFDTRAIAGAYRGERSLAPRTERGDMTPEALAAWVTGR